MKFRRTPVLALVAALAVGLVAAPPATSAPASQTAAGEQGTAAAKKSTKKGTITGKVTFRGKPAKNVRVSAVSGERAYRARTNSKGRFTLEVPARTYKVYADPGSHNSYRTYAGGTLREQDAKKIKVRKGRTVTANVKLAKAATIKGRVLDPQGRPLSADLEIMPLDRPGKYREDFSSSDGRYKIKYLPAGRIQIYAYAHGTNLGVAELVVRAKAGRTVTAPDIVLQPVRLGVLTAKVEWACEPHCPEDLFMPVFAVNESDSSTVSLKENPKTGLWSAEVRAGTYRVSFKGTNVATGPVTVTDGATVHTGAVVVPPATGVVTGKVLKKNGKPVPKGTVVFVDDSIGGRTARLETAKNGTFRAENVAPGAHTLHVLWPKSTWGGEPDPLTVTVADGETTTANIQFETGHTVKGKVTHRGKGVKGMRVHLMRGDPYDEHPETISATTSSKGRFTFKNVPTSTFRLVVMDTSPQYGAVYQTLTVTKNVKGLRIKVKK